MKLILVEWLDSHSGRGWHTLEELSEHSVPLYCRSVGWLVAKNKDCYVIAAHIGGEKNKTVQITATGDLAIPRKAVVKITTLKQ